MALTVLNQYAGIQLTREDYALPTPYTTNIAPNRWNYRGNDHDLVQGIEIDLAGVAMTITSSTNTYGGFKLGSFPKGGLCFLQAVLTGPMVGVGVHATNAISYSLGTTLNADASLATTEVDIMASTSGGALTASAATVNIVKAAVTYVDGTAAAKDLYLNFTQSGTVGAGTITWGTGARLGLYYIITKGTG